MSEIFESVNKCPVGKIKSDCLPFWLIADLQVVFQLYVIIFISLKWNWYRYFLFYLGDGIFSPQCLFRDVVHVVDQPTNLVPRVLSLPPFPGNEVACTSVLIGQRNYKMAAVLTSSLPKLTNLWTNPLRCLHLSTILSQIRILKRRICTASDYNPFLTERLYHALVPGLVNCELHMWFPPSKSWLKTSRMTLQSSKPN